MAQITSSVTFIPSAYDSGTFTTSTNATYQTSNALTNTSSTSYARFTMSTTAQYCIYSIGVSGIPSNATINSVTCSVKAGVSSTANTTTRTVQLYAGTTAKGSAYTLPVSSSTTTFSLTPGTWTAAELQNCKIRFDGQRSGNNARYIMFYGAELTVNYTYTSYNITSTIATDTVDSIDPAGVTTVASGDSYTLVINAASVDDFKVEDNGVNVTSSLVRHDVTPGSNTFTGAPVSFDSENSVYNRTGGDNGNGIYSSNTIANGCTPATSTTRCALYSVQQNNAVSYMYYNFDCSSIPLNAQITSVSCSFKGGTQGSTYYSAYIAQMCAGTTAKGSSVSVTGTNTSPSTVTVNGGNSWTRNELNDLKIKFQVTRNSSSSSSASTFSFYGATVSVNYTIPADNPYYWTYTLSNVSADHTIILSDSIIVPPDEDPDKTYYPITISSINATTDPGRGTTRVESGTSETITIYPSDPLVTLITDNGVDVSSQLVAHGGTIPTPTVATSQGASYGFAYSSSTGYYVSQNAGVDKSAAVCRVSFDLPVRCLVTIQYINYAEATYDFGVFGNIDTSLNTSYYAAGSGGATITDTSYKLACNTSTYNTSSVQTLTYEINSGQHYIDIKYSKDDATYSNNDTLQWKITSIEPLEPNNYYTYTLSNINQEHSLIFIFGDVTYFFVNSSTANDNCTLYPNGSMVQLPGDTYKLTIVPKDSAYTASITDNNVDVTNNLERVETEVTKDGVTTTVVNYIYTLSNVQTGHTLYVTASPSSLPSYIKKNSAWVLGSIFIKGSNAWAAINSQNVFVKQNGTWSTGVTTHITNTCFRNGGNLDQNAQ